MAKFQKKTQKSTRRSLIMVALLVVALAIALVAVAKGTNFIRSNAANPLTVVPCTGNWNLTDCFGVGNPTKAPIRFAYLIDCYDNTYCVDTFKIVTLQPGGYIVLGQPNGCSKWQLDLNWSSPDTVQSTGAWQWGGVVEKSTTAVCNCNYTEVNIMPAVK